MRRIVLAVVLGALGCNTGPGTQSGQKYLIPPLTSQQGLTLSIPRFQVPTGGEVQDCYFIRVPDLGGGRDLWVNRVQIALSSGSHHFNIYRVRQLYALSPDLGTDVDLDGIPARYVKGGECFNSSNFQDWPLVVNSQHSDPNAPPYDWQLPEGVAFKLQPGELLMLQPHFVNAGEQITPDGSGQVTVNFHRSPLEQPIELGTLFATQQNIRICQSAPNQVYSGTCRFPASDRTTITAVNGHFHLRGRNFDIRTWDGLSDERPPDSAMFYESYRWQEPAMSTGLDVPVVAGGGIWWTCEYQWTPPLDGCDRVNAYDRLQANDCCYTFGPRVESQEHCNVFLYYYPKTEDVFCN
jgi:hypothetical protein